VSALLNELDIDQEDPTVSTIMNFLKGYTSKEIRGVAISYRTVDPFGEPVLGTGSFFLSKRSESKRRCGSSPHRTS